MLRLFSSRSERNAVEQAAGSPAVRFDLRAERVHVRERALVAQALHERYAQRRLVQIAMGIEQVCLDLEAIDIAERGTHPHIRYGGISKPPDGRGRGRTPLRGRS